MFYWCQFNSLYFWKWMPDMWLFCYSLQMLPLLWSKFQKNINWISKVITGVQERIIKSGKYKFIHHGLFHWIGMLLRMFAFYIANDFFSQLTQKQRKSFVNYARDRSLRLWTFWNHFTFQLFYILFLFLLISLLFLFVNF